ncbi:MAG TPA: LPXTG cell wall anchor domain-containing protein, partial [Candidatus Acidoferrum sp.]|nr:LPXTG cell wall anchor domain-containing protein [Candidatus Acidoferrum sp.]
ERGSTRIVALGDSTFWANTLIESDANREFAASTVNWLVQQGLLLGEIPRQQIRTYKLTITNVEMRNSRWLLLAGMPGAVMLIGVFVWMRRRK